MEHFQASASSSSDAAHLSSLEGYLGADTGRSEVSANNRRAKGPSSPPPQQGNTEEAMVSFDGQNSATAQGPASSSSPLHKQRDETAVAGRNGAEVERDGGDEAYSTLVRRGLPRAVKEFIVENLACFQTHHAVREAVSKQFGIAVDGRTVAAYDPAHRHGRLGTRLRALYDDTRKRYIGDVAQVAISHQAQRLRLISKVVDKASTSKDYAAALKGLELAAKEMGGVLAGHSVVEHRGTVGHVHASVEDARREVAMRLAQVVEGGMLLAAPVPAPTEEEGEAP